MLRKELFNNSQSTNANDLSLEWFGFGSKEVKDAEIKAQRGTRELIVEKKDLRKYSKEFLTSFKDVLKGLGVDTSLNEAINKHLVGPQDSGTILMVTDRSELNEANVFDLLLYGAGRNIGHMASKAFRIDVSHLVSNKKPGEILFENKEFVATFFKDGDESLLYLYTKYQVVPGIKFDSDARDLLFDFVKENISESEIHDSSVNMSTDGIGEFRFWIKDTSRLVRDDRLEGLELTMNSSRNVVAHIFSDRVYQGSIFKFKNEYVKLVVAPPKYKEPVLMVGI